MDKNLSASVIKVFIDLYNKGLIYKSKKLVNWDTVLKTAVFNTVSQLTNFLDL